jgi:predicted house-cleaning noncanonical NTP pyrophosphatase (MazG superfamily)
MNKNKYSFKWLSAGISTLTRDYLFLHNYFIALLRNSWPEIIGTVNASHSLPEAIYNKTLMINVDDPVWIQELNLIKDDIKEGISKYFNNKRFLNLFDNIRFQNGKTTTFESIHKHKYIGKLDPKILKEIDNTLKDINDPDLHEALRHYLIQSQLKYETII